MRPPRGIDLPRGNPHGPQSGHGKGRLLAAPPLGIPHGCRRRHGTAVARRVDHLLVAPVVHLQNGLFHTEPLDALFQLVIEGHARGVEVLVVDPHGQHVVQKQVVRHRPPPGHLFCGPKRGAHIGQIELRRIIGGIPDGHVGIEEFHSVPFFRGGLGGQFGEPVRSFGDSLGDTLPGLRLLHQPAAAAAGGQQGEGPCGKKCFLHGVWV